MWSQSYTARRRRRRHRRLPWSWVLPSESVWWSRRRMKFTSGFCSKIVHVLYSRASEEIEPVKRNRSRSVWGGGGEQKAMAKRFSCIILPINMLLLGKTPRQVWWACFHHCTTKIRLCASIDAREDGRGNKLKFERAYLFFLKIPYLLLSATTHWLALTIAPPKIRKRGRPSMEAVKWDV